LEEYHPFDYKNMGFNNHLNESINNWKNWPEEINEQINTYLTLVKNQYFSELSAPVDTLKNLINRNNNLPLTERLKNLETFLEEKNRNSHPDIRKLFMESYANSLYEYMNGPDDNSDEYIQKIKPYIDSYKDKLIANDNYELSYMLGNKLISQRKLSYFLKPEFKITKNLLEDDKNIAKITKILLLYSDSNKANANSIIDFLTQPLTYKTAHTLYATFVKNAFSLKGQMSDTTTYYKYNAEKDIYEAVQDEIILDNEEEIIDHINRNASPEKLSLYHKNFWQADIKARSPIINRFIYSSISDYELNVKWEKYFNKCMEYIINMEDPNKEHIINIAHSYLMAREDYARKTFLSTAVVSNETLSEKSISLGHILNKLLSQTPSGLKVLQAIDSSSDVGENIKKDIKFSKSNKDSIPKWEIWEMLDDKTILPETEREKISHLYHSYKASFWLTCIIENKEGQKKAVQILNPNERNVAKNEFRIFTQSLENLKETTSRKLVPIVKDMIEVAKNNAENETNTKTGYEQAKTAHSIYDNTTITIGNHKFTFYVTPWESISKNSKVLEEAPGLAVDELPNETKEDIAYKKNVALAKLSKEFSIIFTGGNFDYDRHSKQQNIYKISEKETMIWLYDHGCMSLTPPKEEEKEILGELTYKIFKSFEKQNSNNKENDNVVDVIQHITEELKKEDKLTRYIVKIKKALLALNDFMKYLTQEEIIDALMVGIKSAALDKSIKKGFENHASQSEIEKFSMLQNKLIPMSLVNNSNIKSIKKEKSDFKTIIEYQQTNDGQYISIPINIKFERPEENEKNNNDSKDNQDDKAMSPITSVIFESALDYQHE
jgi:hypothetical protein